MPNYDIIPLAADLLDYTIQRVKTKEAEYVPVNAFVTPGGGQYIEKRLYEKVKINDKAHFPKSQTFHLCKLLEDCAARILECCISADGRYFETEYEARLTDLNNVLIACNLMQQYINLSYKRNYITGDQCAFWGELVRPIRQKAFAWKRNDSTRAEAMRAAKDLATKTELAREITRALDKPG